MGNGNGNGVHELHIRMASSGQIEINGPIQNLALCHEMLRRARLVLEHEELKLLQRADASPRPSLIVPRRVMP